MKRPKSEDFLHGVHFKKAKEEYTDYLEAKNKELIESLKEEQARIVLLSDGYEDLEKQNKQYLNVLKISLESVIESINSKNQ